MADKTDPADKADKVDKADVDKADKAEPADKADKADKAGADKADKANKVKKGAAVHALREKLENSLEAKASDSRFPPYIFETKGEVLEIEGDYALVKFGQVPAPNVWLRTDQLEAVK
jgi:hypothetical protein